MGSGGGARSSKAIKKEAEGYAQKRRSRSPTSSPMPKRQNQSNAPTPTPPSQSGTPGGGKALGERVEMAALEESTNGEQNVSFC